MALATSRQEGAGEARSVDPLRDNVTHRSPIAGCAQRAHGSPMQSEPGSATPTATALGSCLPVHLANHLQSPRATDARVPAIGVLRSRGSSIGLRWAVIALLGASLIASAKWLGLVVSWPIALPAVCVLVAANLALLRPGVRAVLHATPRTLAATVLLDMIAIATVLAASGGPANPFSALLFVYVALAASLLPTRITYLLGATAAFTFGGLFFVPRAPACACGAADAGAFSTHLVGMWVAFALSAALVVYFLTRVRTAIEERDRALERLARRAADADRFAAIGTLAAGAAHELATPLGTIHILASELAESGDADARPVGSAIAAQVMHCREVLRRMQPGATRATSVGIVDLGAVVRGAVGSWRAAHPDADVIVERADAVAVSLGRADVEAAISVLLDNALHATRAARRDAPIVVNAVASKDGPRMSVTDAGQGVPPEMRDRIGEPFFTTKAPGEGMGLGLYVIRSLVEDAGGKLEIESQSPHGTSVSIQLARPALGAGA